MSFCIYFSMMKNKITTSLLIYFLTSFAFQLQAQATNEKSTNEEIIDQLVIKVNALENREIKLPDYTQTLRI